VAARKQFLLRIDPKLWIELEAWAADELRSVNGQIEYLLREAVRKRKSGSRPVTAAEPSPGTTEEERAAVGKGA
jgi:hypothetical protein